MNMIEIMTERQAVIRNLMEGGKYSAPRTHEEAEAYLKEKEGKYPYHDLRGWHAYFYIGKTRCEGCSGILENGILTVSYPPEGDEQQFGCENENQARAILLDETRPLYYNAISKL